MLNYWAINTVLNEWLPRLRRIDDELMQLEFALHYLREKVIVGEIDASGRADGEEVYTDLDPATWKRVQFRLEPALMQNDEILVWRCLILAGGVKWHDPEFDSQQVRSLAQCIDEEAQVKANAAPSHNPVRWSELLGIGNEIVISRHMPGAMSAGALCEIDDVVQQPELGSVQAESASPSEPASTPGTPSAELLEPPEGHKSRKLWLMLNELKKKLFRDYPDFPKGAPSQRQLAGRYDYTGGYRHHSLKKLFGGRYQPAETLVGQFGITRFWKDWKNSS